MPVTINDQQGQVAFSNKQPRFEVILTEDAKAVCEEHDIDAQNYIKYATTNSAAIELRIANVSKHKSASVEWRNMKFSSIRLQPGGICTVHTGIKLFLISDDGRQYAGLALPRSGLGSRGLVLRNTVGLIDPDYQGEIMLNIKNNGDEPLDFSLGERIAQLFITPVTQSMFNVVTEFSSATERGDGGFNSTGKQA